MNTTTVNMDIHNEIYNLNEYIFPEITRELREYVFGVPKNNYDLVIKEINDKFGKNRCNSNCRFKPVFMFGEIVRRPVLLRYTRIICPLCDSIPLSEYGHTACYECATEENHPEEYEYFHRYC